MTALFREQAITQQLQRLHGEVVVLPRVSHSLVSLILALIIGAAVLLLLRGGYSRKETVSGWLEPASGVTRVFAERSGIVKAIYVRAGDVIKVGEPILEVNGDQYLSDGRSLDEAMLSELTAQRDRIRQQLERMDKTEPMQRNKVLTEKRSTERDIILIEQQIVSVQRQQVIIDKQLGDARRLADAGHATQSRVDDLVSRQSQIESELVGLERTLAQQRNQLDQLAWDLMLMPNRELDMRDSLSAKLAQLEQQMLELHGRRGFILNAPTSGRVTSLQIEEGQRLPTSQPVLAIVPENAEFEAKVLMPVEASGFIQPGQSVQIRYDSFPYQKFGSYQGRVARVSKSVLLPDELLNVPVEIKTPVYQATVWLDQQTAEAYGQSIALSPGMTFKADIELEERSLLEWLLEPLYSLKGRL